MQGTGRSLSHEDVEQVVELLNKAIGANGAIKTRAFARFAPYALSEYGTKFYLRAEPIVTPENAMGYAHDEALIRTMSGCFEIAYVPRDNDPKINIMVIHFNSAPWIERLENLNSLRRNLDAFKKIEEQKRGVKRERADEEDGEADPNRDRDFQRELLIALRDKQRLQDEVDQLKKKQRETDDEIKRMERMVEEMLEKRQAIPPGRFSQEEMEQHSRKIQQQALAEIVKRDEEIVQLKNEVKVAKDAMHERVKELVAERLGFEQETMNELTLLKNTIADQKRQIEAATDKVFNTYIEEQWRKLVDDKFLGATLQSLGTTEYKDEETGCSYWISPTEDCKIPRMSLIDELRMVKTAGGPDAAKAIDEADVPLVFRKGDIIQFADDSERIRKWYPGTVHAMVPGNERITIICADKSRKAVSIHRVRFAHPTYQKSAIMGLRREEDNSGRYSMRPRPHVVE